MLRKKWDIATYDKNIVSQLAEELNINAYAVLLAVSRGITEPFEVAEFLGIEETELSDPFALPDMTCAVQRINEAIDNFERIAVFGDYDVDGVTSTALLYSYLSEKGADVIYHIPNRQSEGYGMSIAAVDELSAEGAKLIITVDNGISCVEEAKHIKELGMDLVITDHHLPPEVLPEAAAVVNPHLDNCYIEFKDYAGVGVAYKLICALEGEENEKTKAYLDFVAMGTIADVMPLVCENRELVKFGIKKINSEKRTGVSALVAAAGAGDKTLSSTDVAFSVCPRINAAGRMGAAQRALKLLISTDEGEAEYLAEEICKDNTERQATEAEILNCAEQLIESDNSLKYARVIVVDGENWHEGVIGIVASRITEKYGRPAIVISTTEDNAKGSGRSIEGFSLYDALDNVSDTIISFGGHTLAAGLTIEKSKINLFRKRINEYAIALPQPFLKQRIDIRLNPQYVSTEFLDVIEMLEPFGRENPQPVFGLFNMTLSDVKPIGSGKHLSLLLKRNDSVIRAVKFSMTMPEFPYQRGDVIDAAVVLKSNYYLGEKQVSVIIKNMRFHGVNEEKLLSDIVVFEKIMRREKLTAEQVQSAIPTREQIIAVYKYIKKRHVWRYSPEVLAYRLSTDKFAAVFCATEILVELGLINKKDNVLLMPEITEHKNLDDSELLQYLSNNIHGN